MPYLLGIDFGGGASKATLIDTAGNIAAESTVEYPTLHPTPDACEQRPEDWLRALCAVTRNILETPVGGAPIRPGDILALAVDSATHSFVPADADGTPLRPAVHWTDCRSRAQAEKLRAEAGAEIFAKTFHSPDTIWTLPQLVWLGENEPGVFARTRKIFFEKDYIRYFLTGNFHTDYIEALGSMLFDGNALQWDSGLCRMAGVSPGALPPVIAPTDTAGKVTARAAAATGLAAGTPVVCGTTDTCMEVFASGAVRPGDTTVKLATAGRICVITDRARPDRHLVNYPHIVKGLWYPGTATKAAAASLRWYRDTFGGDYGELVKAAEAVPLGCDGLVFQPYLNGELTPYADPALCGGFTGVRATHTRAHFTRAVLEGVALSLLDSRIYLDGLQIPRNARAVIIGGGAKGALWRQITADALGLTLTTTASSDSSLGSAMLAGMAAGVFADADDAVRKCIKVKDETRPDPENTARYAELFAEYKRLHDALAPLYRQRGK